MLLTQIQLIKDPLEDFYVHNDAAWSFYNAIMSYVLPCEWDELYGKTIGSGLFVHYPFAAFIFGAIGKIGLLLDVIDLRLFLRLHIFTVGALIIGIVSDIFAKRGINPKKKIAYVVPFGLFSFLYIQSAIFSRDIHVTLIYTIGGYLFLNGKVKGKGLLFVLLFIVATGLRPQNGLLFLIYPVAYYSKKMSSRIGIAGLIVAAIICVAIYLNLQNEFSMLETSLKNYDGRSLSNTGGLFIKLYTLPFPLNTIIMDVYMLLMPLPANLYLVGDGSTWLNLPNVLSLYIMFSYIVTTLFYLFHAKEKNDNIKILILVELIVFTAIVFGSPDLRRAFAAIPGLFMCYCLVDEKLPVRIKKSIINPGWFVITLIQVFFLDICHCLITIKT